MNLEYKTKYLKYKKKYFKLKEILGGSVFATDDGPNPQSRRPNPQSRSLYDLLSEQGSRQPTQRNTRMDVLNPNRAPPTQRNTRMDFLNPNRAPPTQRNTRMDFLNPNRAPPTQPTQPIQINQAPTFERAKEDVMKQMILEEGNKFYKLINERINENDNILIIDFENIRIKISSRIETLKKEFNNLLIQKKNDRNITELVYKRANYYIPREQEHIIAWLFLIKYYLVSKMFDKIILLCKEATWDEWYEYAFSIFDNGENLKSKVFIVKLKIDGNKKHELWPKPNGRGKHSLKALDDFTMYFIKFYLEANGKKNITILTLDGRIKDDFEKYKNILYYLKNNKQVARDLNLRYKMTISHKELGFTQIKNKANVVEVRNDWLNNSKGSILYDYNKLKHFVMPEKPSQDILNDVFNNFFSGIDFPEIENFTYNKIVDTMEDLKTNNFISPEEFEDYKKNIIEGEGIKRSEYIIKNISNVVVGIEEDDDRKIPAEEQVPTLTKGQKKKQKQKRRKMGAAAAIEAAKTK